MIIIVFKNLHLTLYPHQKFLQCSSIVNHLTGVIGVRMVLGEEMIDRTTIGPVFSTSWNALYQYSELIGATSNDSKLGNPFTQNLFVFLNTNISGYCHYLKSVAIRLTETFIHRRSNPFKCKANVHKPCTVGIVHRKIWTTSMRNVPKACSFKV